MVQMIAVAGICSTVILALFGLSIYLMSTVNPEEIAFDDDSSLRAHNTKSLSEPAPVKPSLRTNTNTTNNDVAMVMHLDGLCYVTPKAPVKGRRSIMEKPEVERPGMVLQIIDDTGEARIEIFLHPRRSLKKKSRKKKTKHRSDIVQTEGAEVIRNSVIKIMPDNRVVFENIDIAAEVNETSHNNEISNVSAISVSKNLESNTNDNKTESVTEKTTNVSDPVNKNEVTSNVHNSTDYIVSSEYTLCPTRDILKTSSASRSFPNSMKDIFYTEYTKFTQIRNSTTQSTINIRDLTSPILNTETTKSISNFINDIFNMKNTKQPYYITESTGQGLTSHDSNSGYTQNITKSSDNINTESTRSIRYDDDDDKKYTKPLISILPNLSKSVTASPINVQITNHILNTEGPKNLHESTSDILITRTTKNLPDIHDILKRGATTKVANTTKGIVNTAKGAKVTINDNAAKFENSVTDYHVKSKSALVSSTLRNWGY